MVEGLIRDSSYPESGFYLNEYDKLIDALVRLKKSHKKTLLIGVSFALLDLAEKFEADLEGIIVMETGGMKGRRKEMVREELHEVLKERFNLECVHSEYGMTEMLSQAYSKADGIFSAPAWMKVLIRDSYDPFNLSGIEGTGVLNIIDLANLQSCSFLATSDVGRLYGNGSFEVLGRMDNSDIRGCNLMVE
jgi:phenylacetate-coenzyme A ligase PaaK-like adenylate-forming protein